MSVISANEFGLYLHIPFCHSICHYCDFSKTANFSNDQVQRYFSVLEAKTVKILEHRKQLGLPKPTTVFFGGGTPGMFAEEYQALFKRFSSMLADDAEISMAANPEDVTEERLKYWRDLGFNRLSMGVQSFSPEGLKFLTRQHSPEKTTKAIELALKYFDNLNIDLIYGWKDQSKAQWLQDLKHAVDLGVPHLSLYNLTFEQGTTLGRKKSRGLIPDIEDEHLEELYLAAVNFLKEGWIHDEVSNWSRPGYSCRHNWIYWRGGHFIGVGSGAHGFLPEPSPLGTRYYFSKEFRSFISDFNADLPAANQEEVLRNIGAKIDEGRDRNDWLLEFVGSGLRTRHGVPIEYIEKLLECKFIPRKILQSGIDMGLVSLQDGQLRLDPKEWFRENRWSLEVAMSFNYL